MNLISRELIKKRLQKNEVIKGRDELNIAPTSNFHLKERQS